MNDRKSYDDPFSYREFFFQQVYKVEKNLCKRTLFTSVSQWSYDVHKEVYFVKVFSTGLYTEEVEKNGRV